MGRVIWTEPALQDLDEVRESLSPGNDPGEQTQLLAQEVIDGLDRLRLALEEELRRRNQQQQQQGGQPPPQGGQKRLVPPVAELLTLKEMQIEVLERTRRLESAKERSGEDFDPIQERILERLVQRQGSLVELTSQIAGDLEEQLGGEDAPAGEGEDPPEDDSVGTDESGTSDEGGGR